MNSDGRFKKVLFDDGMINSNRTFAITKLKNNIKLIDSFVSNGNEILIILTSLGRLFKFDLSNEYITPTTKQSLGLLLVKLLPSEKIVSCCKSNNEKNIYLVSQKGKFFSLKIIDIHFAHDSTLGYLNDNVNLKNDYFIKILPSSQYIDIETNRNQSARLNFNKLDFKKNKNIFIVDFLDLEKDEYLENCFRLEKYLD